MICNFDPRRNIPYAFSNDETLGHHIEIMPYSVFLNRLINNDGVATFFTFQSLISIKIKMEVCNYEKERF